MCLSLSTALFSAVMGKVRDIIQGNVDQLQIILICTTCIPFALQALLIVFCSGHYARFMQILMVKKELAVAKVEDCNQSILAFQSKELGNLAIYLTGDGLIDLERMVEGN